MLLKALGMRMPEGTFTAASITTALGPDFMIHTVKVKSQVGHRFPCLQDSLVCPLYRSHTTCRDLHQEPGRLNSLNLQNSGISETLKICCQLSVHTEFLQRTHLEAHTLFRVQVPLKYIPAGDAYLTGKLKTGKPYFSCKCSSLRTIS